MSRYEVVIKSDTGITIPNGVITRFSKLVAGRADRCYVPIEIVIPQDEERYPVGTFKKDMIIELWREQNDTMVLDGETCYFLRGWKYYKSGGKDLIYLKGYDSNYLLDGREVEYNAGSDEAAKTDVACDMMKEIVDENFVSATDTDRNLAATLLTIQADDGQGATVTDAFSRQYVYPLLQKICNQSREAGTWVTFDTYYSGTLPLEFRTYVNQRGADLTDSLLLSAESGNIANPVLDEDYTDEITVAYVAGKGVEDERIVGSASNTTRLNQSVWSRREFITENFQLDVEASCDSAAQVALDKYAPRIYFSGEIVETVGTQYGINWNYGDKIRARYLDYEFDCMVLAYLIEYGENDGKITDKVTATIRGEIEA